jgi:hypothetical protein
VATDALLKFLAERTRPPEVAIVRFTRDFLHLALAINSSTIEASWPAALAMMAPELRSRVAAEAASSRLVETWRLAQRKTELTFEEVVLEDRTPSLLAVRATLLRKTGPLVEGAGPSSADRVQGRARGTHRDTVPRPPGWPGGGRVAAHAPSGYGLIVYTGGKRQGSLRCALNGCSFGWWP